MDTLVNQFETYFGLYMMLVIVVLAFGTVLAIDVLSPRRQRGARDVQDIPDYTRAVHMNHPWAGMDESGPDIP